MMFPKPVRVKDRRAIEAARRPYCEWCWRWGPTHVHHIKSRGSGGGDVPENLISLCVGCHDRAHRGLIAKADLTQRKAEILAGRWTAFIARAFRGVVLRAWD